MGDSTEFDVVVVGSCNLDLVSTTDHLPSPGETLRAVTYAEHAGGKGLNQAVACARMGARVALTTYNLPMVPGKMPSFNEFHQRFGKYVLAAAGNSK